MSLENLKTFLHLLSHLILMIILAATVRTPQHARLLLTHRHQGPPFFLSHSPQLLRPICDLRNYTTNIFVSVFAGERGHC